MIVDKISKWFICGLLLLGIISSFGYVQRVSGEENVPERTFGTVLDVSIRSTVIYLQVQAGTHAPVWVRLYGIQTWTDPANVEIVRDMVRTLCSQRVLVIHRAPESPYATTKTVSIKITGQSQMVDLAEYLIGKGRACVSDTCGKSLLCMQLSSGQDAAKARHAGLWKQVK